MRFIRSIVAAIVKRREEMERARQVIRIAGRSGIMGVQRGLDGRRA